MWKGRPELEGDAYAALESLKQAILKDPTTEKKYLILAGDILDEKKVDAVSLKHFTDFVDDLYDAGVRVFFIQGNHDLDAMHVASVQGATSLNEKTVRIDDRMIHGLDWRPREKLKEDLLKVPDCDVLVLHCSFEHLLGFKDASDLTLEDIPENVKNVFVGDVHTTNVTTLRGTGACVSPGALHPCDITQGGAHGCYKLPHGKSSARDWEFLPIETRSIFRYSWEDKAETEAFIKLIKDDLKKENGLKPLVEIKYPTSASADVTALREELEDKAFFFSKGSSTGKLLVTEGLESAEETMKSLSWVDALGICVDEKKDKELYDLMHSLLTSPDPEAIIQARIEEVMNDPEESGASQLQTASS
jgi:DNA repair exonuclease SbcCD nuclease subunit